MTTHTPGPWNNRHFNSGGQIVVSSSSFRGPNTLALLNVSMTYNAEHECYECTADDIAEAEANARLITAAPDMLTQLRIWLAIFSRGREYVSPLVRAATNGTAAIIAEVEGKNNR